MFGIITRAAADCHPQTSRMREVPMAALAAPVHKAGLFQVGYQLSHFARHSSIKIVSQTFVDVNNASESAKRRNFFDGGAERFQFMVSVFLMFGFRFVAGEFHPQFPVNALIRQCACETVPQGVKSAA